jgi:hypothetical protein
MIVLGSDPKSDLYSDGYRANQAIFAFRRYEDASLHYTGIESHPGITHYGLYDTVVATE